MLPVVSNITSGVASSSCRGNSIEDILMDSMSKGPEFLAKVHERYVNWKTNNPNASESERKHAFRTIRSELLKGK